MILGVIQARLSSKRLPGKVLMEMNGRPMLEWVIRAVNKAETVDQVIVATSHLDTEIVKFAENFCGVYAGDLSDVLDRYYQAALWYRPSHIVRITGDCPLMDPYLIDQTVRHHLEQGNDYTANFINGLQGARLYGTDGLDVEVFTYETLLKAYKLCRDSYDKEHVTPYMRTGDWCKAGHFIDYFAPGEKISVDTMEDFERVGNRLCMRSQNLY